MLSMTNKHAFNASFAHDCIVAHGCGVPTECGMQAARILFNNGKDYDVIGTEITDRGFTVNTKSNETLKISLVA